jgi:hypothetical protein
MAYQLIRLAPGSYDVMLDGIIVAGLVRNHSSSDATWTAELLVDLPLQERPFPFTEPEHVFTALEEASTWLGGAEMVVQSTNGP